MKMFRFLSGVMLTLGLTAGLAAQPPTEGNLTRFFFMHVKSGMQAQFEAGFKAHSQWRREQGDPWTWQVFQIVNGEQLGDYAVMSVGHNWADFDAYEPFLIKAGPHFWASVGAYLEGVSGYISRGDPSISRWPEDPSSVRYVQVTDYYLKPDRVSDFVKTVKQIHEAIGKSGWPAEYLWDVGVNGGRGSVMTLVLPAESYADMAPPEKPMDAMLTEVYGAEKAGELFTTLQGAIEHTESLIAKARPDLLGQ